MFKKWSIFVGLIILGMLLFTCKDALASRYRDYSDAPGYGWAWHGIRSSNTSWQWFGRGVSSESHPRVVDTFDDGFSFGEFKPGESANLQFTAHSRRRSSYYRPVYEHIKIWMDWNQDRDFNDAGENIYSYSWKLPTNYGIKTLHKVVSFLVPTDALYGSTWMRARIMCQRNIGPYGYATQGEVEDYQADVVPEPTTMILLGSLATGLFGMAGIRRKRR